MVFLSLSRIILGENLNKATTASFQDLHNSSTISHPNINAV
jgi:hypothetical protein